MELRSLPGPAGAEHKAAGDDGAELPQPAAAGAGRAAAARRAELPAPAAAADHTAAADHHSSAGTGVEEMTVLC